MRCINPKIGERLAEYEANLLRGKERWQFEDHLRSCDFCAEEFGTMVATLETVEALPQAWVVEELLRTGRELLRQESWEDAAVTFRALLRVAPDHQEAQEGLRQAEEQLPGLIDLVVKWLSEPWQPQWVGELVTADDIPEQEHSFRMEDGDIEISCAWRSRHQEKPAYLWVSWRANIPTPGELWARFMRPETETVLAEVRLGTHLEGEAEFTSDRLGFDPAKERWAISILLKDVGS
jgi:hypothetical protein